MIDPTETPQEAPRGKIFRPARWRTASLILVHLLMAAHVTHWLMTGRSLGPLAPSEAMELGQTGVVNAGLVLFAVAIVATAIFGRFFCGWACHLVALQDLCRWMLLRIGIRPRPLRSRLLALVPFVAFFYMFAWPATYRWWVGEQLGDVTASFTTSELTSILPGPFVAVLTLFVCGIASVYVLGAKGFCTYACPYGAAFTLVERLAPFRIRSRGRCQQCARCTAACTANVRVHEHIAAGAMVNDPACCKCLECVAACPGENLTVAGGRPPLLPTLPIRRRPGMSWIDELLAGLVFAAVFFTVRGLYGLLPFLMSLGVAAVAGGCALAVLRLATRTDVRFGTWRLKRDGRVTTSGRVFVALAVMMTALLGHSSVIRYHEAMGERWYQRTQPLRSTALDPARPWAALEGDELEISTKAAAYLSRAERWGLISNPQSQLKLAWLSFLAGDPAAFQHRMGRALELQPGLVELHLLRGKEAAARGALDEAANAYTEALRRDPRMVETYLALAHVLAASGDLEGTVQVFKAGSQALPESVDLAYNFGVALAMTGNIEGSQTQFERTLNLDPNNRRARENLASLLLNTGRLAAALPHLELAVELSPEDAANHVMLARTLVGLGRAQDAENELEIAHDLDPNNPGIRALLDNLRRTNEKARLR